MSTEVTEKPKNEVGEVAAWGAAENIDTQDLKIPKILLMQGTSELVGKGQARMGEYRDNVENTLLGDTEAELELIIFDFSKNWRIFQIIPGVKRPKYLRTENYTPENADAAWQEKLPDGTEIMRVKNYNFYALNAKAPALSAELPYVISFARTSAPAAQTINVFFQKLAKVNRPSASIVVGIKSEVQSNDDGTYCISVPRIVRDSKPEEIAVARGWYDSIKKGKARVEVVEGDGEDIPF